MTTLTLNQPASNRHFGAIAIAAGLHMALVYALLSGMAREVTDMVLTPLQVKLVDETPPPPPPPSLQLPPPPPLMAPRPLYVPPPEVHVPPPPAPALTVTATPSPVPELAAAPAPPAPRPAPVLTASPPAPPPPARHLAHAASLDVSRCERPTYPAMALRQEATGTTRIRFTVDALGRVQGAQLLHPSGHDRAHRALDQAAIAALSQCAFKPGADDRGRATGGDAVVEYVWKMGQ